MLLDGEEFTTKCTFMGIFTTACENQLVHNLNLKNKFSIFRKVNIVKQNYEFIIE
jgi:hypothetical protein